MPIGKDHANISSSISERILNDPPPVILNKQAPAPKVNFIGVDKFDDLVEGGSSSSNSLFERKKKSSSISRQNLVSRAKSMTEMNRPYGSILRRSNTQVNEDYKKSNSFSFRNYSNTELPAIEKAAVKSIDCDDSHDYDQSSHENNGLLLALIGNDKNDELSVRATAFENHNPIFGVISVFINRNSPKDPLSFQK